MNERSCIKCNEELFKNENCFGNIKTREYICQACFEEMNIQQRKGIVPVTSIITSEWKIYVNKFGLKI